MKNKIELISIILRFFVENFHQGYIKKFKRNENNTAILSVIIAIKNKNFRNVFENHANETN